MLVLGRGEGEAVLLRTADGWVRVSVGRIEGSAVRLGIDAPAAVKVLREEVLLREAAAAVPPAASSASSASKKARAKGG